MWTARVEQLSEGPSRLQVPLGTLVLRYRGCLGEGRGGGGLSQPLRRSQVIRLKGEAWAVAKNRDRVIRNGLKLEMQEGQGNEDVQVVKFTSIPSLVYLLLKTDPDFKQQHPLLLQKRRRKNQLYRTNTFSEYDIDKE